MKTLKKVWNAVTSAVLVVVILLMSALAVAQMLGYKRYTVLSGSMEPTFHTGSMIFVKPVDALTLEEGDVITFMLGEDSIATHRIIEIVSDEADPEAIRFRTKGDANKEVDSIPVHYKNVIGEPVFSIPKLGYVASFLQQPKGRYVAVSAGAFMILFSVLPMLLSKDEESEETEKAEENPQ